MIVFLLTLACAQDMDSAEVYDPMQDIQVEDPSENLEDVIDLLEKIDPDLVQEVRQEIVREEMRDECHRAIMHPDEENILGWTMCLNDIVKNGIQIDDTSAVIQSLRLTYPDDMSQRTDEFWSKQIEMVVPSTKTDTASPEG